jgi:hypothetical protein
MAVIALKACLAPSENRFHDFRAKITFCWNFVVRTIDAAALWVAMVLFGFFWVMNAGMGAPHALALHNAIYDTFIVAGIFWGFLQVTVLLIRPK